MNITTYNKIKELYYNPELGLQSKTKLYEKLKDNKIKMKDIEAFLSSQETYQLHNKPKRIKKYFPIYSHYPFEKVQSDLLDLSNLSSTNSNVKYLLLCIDVYSRYVYFRKINNKTNETVTHAMKEILKEIGKPVKILQCDLGSEFISKSFKYLMKDNEIKVEYSEVGNHKSLGNINRFCLTIRNLIEKYMTTYNTTTYTNALSQLFKNYNNTVHRTIHMTPKEALKDESLTEFMNNQQYNAQKEEQFFKIGDKVRYITNQSAFDKKIFTKMV